MGAAALFVYIFCTDQLGDTNGVSGFAPDRAAAFFQHRLSGGHELPQAGSPLTGGFFSAPAERGTRTALACSPLTGGEFFAEPQRGGIRRLRTAGASRHPPRGQKGRTTCGFPSSLNSYLSLVREPDADQRAATAPKRGTAEGFSSAADELPSESVLLSSLFAVSETVLLHRSATSSRRGITVPRNSLVWRLRKAPTI